MAKLGLRGKWTYICWRRNLLWAHKRSGATKILIFQQAIQIFVLRLQKPVCVCVRARARANNNISTRSGKTLQSWPLFEPATLQQLFAIILRLGLYYYYKAICVQSRAPLAEICISTHANSSFLLFWLLLELYLLRPLVNSASCAAAMGKFARSLARTVRVGSFARPAVFKVLPLNNKTAGEQVKGIIITQSDRLSSRTHSVAAACWHRGRCWAFSIFAPPARLQF